MRPLRRVVVVGNGIAGLTAADTLRAEGYDGELSIVGDEPAYSRPALSKALLRDDPSAHELPPAAHGAGRQRPASAFSTRPQGATVGRMRYSQERR